MGDHLGISLVVCFCLFVSVARRVGAEPCIIDVEGRESKDEVDR